MLFRHLLDFGQSDHHVIQRRQMIEEQENLEGRANLLADFVFVVTNCCDLFCIWKDLPLPDSLLQRPKHDLISVLRNIFPYSVL